MSCTNAVDMALARDIDPKRFRAALRRAGLPWHSHNGRWEVDVGSSEHADMLRVLATLSGIGASMPDRRAASTKTLPARQHSDEAWIIDICDAELKCEGLRQHHFPFLLGDPGPSGRRAPLPVDAFYPDFSLVVEYHERQHTQRVNFFDERMTVSGVARGEQRRRYDDYRRTLLPQHGYRLVVFDYLEFETTSAGRLRRTSRDKDVVAAKLRESEIFAKGGAHAPPDPNR